VNRTVLLAAAAAALVLATLAALGQPAANNQPGAGSTGSPASLATAALGPGLSVTLISTHPPRNTILSATATPYPSSTATVLAVGPAYRPGFNPLTGLPVSNLHTLLKVPMLVSITEFPPSARPQAGLSAAAQVWETSIGEGMSRFLAVYYGDYLEVLSDLLERHPELTTSDPAIGPIRSGRVGYQEIKLFYPGALLIIRFGSPEVIEQLTNSRTVYADDPNDVNSASLTLAELQALELDAARPSSYAGLSFDPRVPAGGVASASLDLIYSLYNQIRWEYDVERGTYHRSQDQADGSGALVPSFDQLSGDRLQADNVLVLFAEHKYQNLQGTILSIELAYVPKRYGLLFRDGRQFEIQWSSPGLEFQVNDDQGRPVPLRPGVTYFEVVSYESSWDPEARLVRFHNPPLPTLTMTLTPTPTLTVTPTATESAAPPTGTATP
jgi:hypothetical protein